MKFLSTTLRFCLVLLILSTLTACNSGSGSSTDAGNGGSDATNPIDNTNPTEPPKYSGFDLPVGTGAYWEFGVQHYVSEWSQGGSNYSGTTSGTFRVVLGKAKVIGNTTLYKVYKVQTSGTSGSPNLGWTYLGVQNNNLVGSNDGTSVHVVFDAQNGYQNGGGLFASFSGLVTASPGTLSNPFVESGAVVLNESYDQSSCEYFPGYGTICGSDQDINTTTREYYKPQVGPLGYYYRNSYSFSGGGYSSGGTEEWQVGLIDYSFVGDGYYIPPEVSSLSSGDVAIYYGLYNFDTLLRRDVYNALTPIGPASQVMRYIYNKDSSEPITAKVPANSYTGNILLTEGDTLLLLSTYGDSMYVNSFQPVDPATNTPLAPTTSVDTYKLTQVNLGGITYYDNALRFMSKCNVTSCWLYNQPVGNTATEVGNYYWRHLMTDGVGYNAGLYTPQYNDGSNIIDVYSFLEHNPVTTDVTILSAFGFQTVDATATMRDFAMDKDAFYFSTVDYATGQAAVWRWLRNESNATTIWSSTLVGTNPSVMIDADNGWVVINAVTEAPLTSKAYLYNPNTLSVSELNLPGDGVKLNLQIHVMD